MTDSARQINKQRRSSALLCISRLDKPLSLAKVCLINFARFIFLFVCAFLIMNEKIIYRVRDCLFNTLPSTSRSLILNFTRIYNDILQFQSLILQLKICQIWNCEITFQIAFYQFFRLGIIEKEISNRFSYLRYWWVFCGPLKIGWKMHINYLSLLLRLGFMKD